MMNDIRLLSSKMEVYEFFDKEQIIGVFGPLNIPLEEYLFFIIIPLAAIMTIEAVRAVKKHWIIGDEK